MFFNVLMKFSVFSLFRLGLGWCNVLNGVAWNLNIMGRWSDPTLCPCVILWWKREKDWFASM